MNANACKFFYITIRLYYQRLNKQLPIREDESTNNILGAADSLPIDQLLS